MRTPPALLRSSRRALARLADEGSSESGVTLIEVIISALLVGMIVVVTFNAFALAQRAGTNQREHNQATLLAAQDEERLRGLQLIKLTQVGHESHTVTQNGTEYTVESLAEYVSGGSEEDTLACGSTGKAEFIKSTTIVRWLEYGRNPPVRKAVKQSSLVSVPSSTTLEVKVVNQAAEPVSGATVTVKGASTNLSQTTLANGCIVFGSVADKTVEVNATKTGSVGHNGGTPTPKTVTLSSTATTTEELTLAESGSLLVEFDTNGGATRGLLGDTAYIGQSGIPSPANFVAGTPGTFATSILQGELFPFASPSKYTVFAGDCEANNPEKVVSGGSVTDEKILLEPGKQGKVTVEEPQVNLLVKTGTGSSSPGSPLQSTSAKLINKECSAASSQNHTSVPYEHPIKVVAGRLEPRYAPYAKSLELCVAWGPESSKYYKYTTAFANTAKAGTTETTLYARNGTGLTSSTTALTC